jgi:hypothetical protein
MDDGGTTTASGTGGSATTGASATTGTSATAATTGVSGGTTGSNGDGGIIMVDGGNMVPAGYTGTPFTQNVIPGFIYAANYDKGGPGVAYCHSATAMGATACAGGIKLSDWCCSGCNAAGNAARCDAHSMTACMGGLTTCPLYRPDNDNAGLSHMNLGEVDTYAVAGPTWVAGANGPTLTGPMVTVGTPVPQHANMTTADDTYLSYTNSGEWQKYTVIVLAAGTYKIGALMGTPPNVKITMDFGNGVTTGMLALPASPVSAACKCIEAYHAWNPVDNIGTITFPAAGTYLMTMTLNTGNYNPLYFTFHQ